MLKKILFSLLVVLMLHSTGSIIYHMYEPGDDVTTIDTSYVTYESLSEFLLNSPNGSVHYLFLYSKNNQDCVYVKDTVLTTVSQMTQLDMNNILTVVDITMLESEFLTNSLKTEWDVNSYPAFLAVQVLDGQTTVLNKLEWNPEFPMTSQDIELWLNENDLYIMDIQTIPGTEEEPAESQ